MERLIEQILDGRITSFAQLRMKMELLGEKPDEMFLERLIGSIDRDCKAGEIISQGISRGWFDRLFKDLRMVELVVSGLSNGLAGKYVLPQIADMTGRESRRILKSLARKRPGYLIRFYLQYEGRIDRQSYSYFEEFVLKLSERLAKLDPEFGKYLKRVKERYERNRTLEVSMS